MVCVRCIREASSIGAGVGDSSDSGDYESARCIEPTSNWRDAYTWVCWACVLV